MKLPQRRQFLHLAAGTVALPAVSGTAWAQNYPARLVRLIVGTAPGSPSDIVARLMSQWLSERLGQQFVVENRPGAGFNIATEAVVRSRPDGYTLLFVVTSNAVNASLYDRLNFVFLRDIAPVAGLTRSPYFWVVNPSFSAKAIPEIIAQAKASPGRLNIGGASPTQQVAIELFKMMAGVSILYVPYRGDAPGLTDLLGGQVEMYLGGAATAIEHTKAGRLRALAVTTTTRSAALPDIPTVADSIPGYEASAFFGIGAPKSTPAEIIDKLNKEINAGLSDPKIKSRLANLGATALTGTPADFGKLLAEETEKWGKVVKFAGMKPE
jgi:tripartite-type tricarboxylate transporter receptor subunit TctC